MTQPNFTLEEWNIIGCSLYDGIDSIMELTPNAQSLILLKYEAVLTKVKQVIETMKKELS